VELRKTGSRRGRGQVCLQTYVFFYLVICYSLAEIWIYLSIAHITGDVLLHFFSLSYTFYFAMFCMMIVPANLAVGR